MALKVVTLVGGVGGAKLAHGLAQILEPEQLTIIVNTGDDFWHYGLRICPDLDTVTYTLAGLVDKTNGWGIGGDTRNTLGALQRLGVDTWFGLGDQDIATEDPNLPSNPEALAQGPHRFGRAHFMYEFAKGEAARRGLPCNWQLTVVPGIGHDGAAMSRAAAALWFENRLPGPEELGKTGGAPQW